MMKRMFLTLILGVSFLAGCGINSVTKEELENVKVGDVLVYRFKRPTDTREWFYADKVTRIEGNKIYYNPGKSEVTSGSDHRVTEFNTDKESSINKEDLVKFAAEQGEDRKVIIWIK